MAILTKQQVFAADDKKKELVTIEEWGGDVYVTTLSGMERDAFESSLSVKGDDGKRHEVLDNFRARLVAKTAVDDVGNRIFSEDDTFQLGMKSANALNKVYNVALRLNGFSTEDVKELVKNSNETPGDNSISA